MGAVMTSSRCCSALGPAMRVAQPVLNHGAFFGAKAALLMSDGQDTLEIGQRFERHACSGKSVAGFREAIADNRQTSDDVRTFGLQRFDARQTARTRGYEILDQQYAFVFHWSAFDAAARAVLLDLLTHEYRRRLHHVAERCAMRDSRRLDACDHVDRPVAFGDALPEGLNDCAPVCGPVRQAAVIDVNRRQQAGFKSDWRMW